MYTYRVWINFQQIYLSAQSAGAVEYTECISVEE